MSQPASQWIVLIFPLYFIIWGTGAINGMMFRSYFRKKHPEIAQEVFPSMLERSISSGFKARLYLKNREYAKIPDPEFVKRCDIHRLINRICIWGVGVGLVLIAVLIATAKKH
jgi:hypothetical protein